MSYYNILINDSNENSSGLSSCSTTFLGLIPSTSYNVSFYAYDSLGNFVMNSSSITTLSVASRDWIPQGNMLMKWVYKIKELWQVYVKQIYVEK